MENWSDGWQKIGREKNTAGTLSIIKSQTLEDINSTCNKFKTAITMRDILWVKLSKM